jgi:hypothetical protein
MNHELGLLDHSMKHYGDLGVARPDRYVLGDIWKLQYLGMEDAHVCTRT